MLDINEPDAPDAPEAEPAESSPPPSEVRVRLASLIGERDGAQANLRAALLAIGKLESQQGLDVPHIEALARLDAQEAEAMSAWSAGAEEAEPTPDVDQRQALSRAVVESKAKSDAATRALGPARTKATAVAARVNAGADGITVAAATIVIEEASSTLDDIRKASHALAVMRSNVGAAREVALRAIEALPSDRRAAAGVPFYRRLARFDNAAVEAMAAPAPEIGNVAEWRDLVSRLALSASARLEG
jgi:hypothetical protein